MNDPQFDVGDKPEETGPVYYEEPPKKGRGCLFYGCLAAVVAGAIGMVMLAAGAYVAWNWYSRMVDEWTATTPLELPKVEAADEKIAEVEARWAVFKAALDKGEEAEIVLSEEDLNILVSREPDLKDHVNFTLNDDKATAKVSFDLTDSGFPRTKGRFFNATCTLTAVLDDEGRMDIRVTDIEVGGKPLPPEISTQLGTENLADQFVRNRQNRDLMSKIRSIEVKDSLVYVKTRKQTASKTDEDKAEATKSEEAKPEEPKAEEAKTDEPAPVDAPPPARPEGPAPAPGDAPAAPVEPAEAPKAAA